jgi:hypothetical protein
VKHLSPEVRARVFADMPALPAAAEDAIRDLANTLPEDAFIDLMATAIIKSIPGARVAPLDTRDTRAAARAVAQELLARLRAS